VLRLPITEATTFILCRPHYPENVGAAARAMKTMGLTRLLLVKPGRLAVPEHEMAYKMAVRSWDVLSMARRTEDVGETLNEFDLIFATTAKRGTSGAVVPRVAADRALEAALGGARIAVVFGNEKTGLSRDDLTLGHVPLRIPMADDQPSINLAQSVQLVAYEWYVTGLMHRNRETVGA
jgi:tRNA (cytidine32/uridine32-2'-O)-methyltransferase